MAEKRMFAKTIIDSDAFLDMPLSTQALYFHLSMRADDDGFLNNAKKIQREIGANQNDYDLLIAKRFIIEFDGGICVIKHWRIHNYIQPDRYKPTIYQEEKLMLSTKTNKAYTLSEIPEELPMDTDCKQNGYNMEPQIRLDKNRIDKDSTEESIPDDKSSSRTHKHKFGEYQHVLLKDDEFEKLKTEYGMQLTEQAITFLDEYIEMKGYKAKNHYLCIRKWVISAVKEKNPNYRGKENQNERSRVQTHGNNELDCAKAFAEKYAGADINEELPFMP